MPAVINPCDKVILYINGLVCNHLASVNEEDVIEIKPAITELDLKLEVEISEDKLKCHLNFTPAMLVCYSVVNSTPVNKLDIQTEQRILEKRKTELQQILDYLKSVHITYGIRMDILEEICEKNEPGRFFIAQGLAPVDAIDDRIEYFFKGNDTQELKIDENKMGNIDYKNNIRYENV